MTSEQKPLVVVPADDPQQIAGSPQLDRLREVADVRVFQGRPENEDDLVRRVQDADIVINSRGHVTWPGQLLARLPQLRMITTCSIGTDSIDLPSAREMNVVVSNVPGRTAPVVAEHAFGLMMAAAKRLAFQTAELKAGRWTGMHNMFLGGKTVGIVGTGCIGGEMARLCRAFGMSVLAWTFHPSVEREEQLCLQYVPLDELFRTCDVVSLHVRLTPETHHLVDREQLAKMKPGSLLVNTARGNVVDTPALIEALQNGHLGGAALDVFDTEPLSADDPLLSCEQLVLSPHNADQTSEGVDLLNAGAVDNVLAWLDGQPQNVVT